MFTHSLPLASLKITYISIILTPVISVFHGFVLFMYFVKHHVTGFHHCLPYSPAAHSDLYLQSHTPFSRVL